MYVCRYSCWNPGSWFPSMRVMGLNGHVQGAHHLLQTLSPQVEIIHAWGLTKGIIIHAW